MNIFVNVIGAGLAGCEAAWQIARHGIKVRLFEMKPKKFSPAHHNPNFAELVCSNSLKSNELTNASGLLKEEMRRIGSLIVSFAEKNAVPAGSALAVDREKFSDDVTDFVKSHKNIEIINEEVENINPNEYTIIATGPLTSAKLSDTIRKIIGESYLHFFDAAAPIVTFESIDLTKAFKASRYGKGSDSYINCPMNKEQYEKFHKALVEAKLADVKDFDKEILFEGCMPIESIAKRGIDTLRFGPLKPVGLVDPATDKEPYAVVQLRQENIEGSLYNIVGFQTRLKWTEQQKIIRMIPGLEHAEIVRFGVMHRNTYINSPVLLEKSYALKDNKKIYFAGQITGVEGYTESAASGLSAGINVAYKILKNKDIVFPPETAIGSLAEYITRCNTGNFQPMHVCFGIIKHNITKSKKSKDKRQRNLLISEKSLNVLDSYIMENMKLTCERIQF